jgi:ABC-type transporter Mla MlaB component
MAVSLSKTSILQAAGKNRAAVLDALRDGPATEIDCSGVIEADLSVLQLLAAARKFADREGKSIIVQEPVSVELGALAQRAGFSGSAEQAWNAFWQDGAAGQ